MTNKILELTEKIYNEGVVKAKEDADQIIAEAKEKANEIIKSATKKEAEILENAKKQALENKKNSDSEIQLAARQFTSNLKQKITNIISASQIVNPIEESFQDVEFIKNIIQTTIQNWNPQKQEELDLKILLPEKDEKELAIFLKSKTLSTLNKGITIEFDSKTKTGFKIAPVNGNYMISFAENDFENLFKGYFRERTKELLFN
ncbi:MAG: V-type ATP synthase subunit E [Bacteroidetes bacterium]|nr:V-type ATP synthase subunit E [Bacteroidota bacterium]